MDTHERIKQILKDAALQDGDDVIFSGNVRIEPDRVRGNFFWGSKPMSRLTTWRINRYLRRKVG